MLKINQLLKKVGLIVMLVCLIFPLGLMQSIQASANASVTLDSPLDGAVVSAGIVTISGTFVDTTDIKLFIDGSTQVDVIMSDPDHDKSGTWHYDFDTSAYSGEVQIAARGLDIDTRYGVGSPTIMLEVNNPDAHIPQVTISNPEDGASVQETVPVEVSVHTQNTIEHVHIRIDSGEWQATVFNGTHYIYEWDTTGIGDKTVSIEANAMDSKGNVGQSLTTYARVGLGTEEPFYMPTQDRAMWIWESETYKLLLNPKSRTVLDAFATDTDTFNSDPITTLYLAVGTYNGMDILEDDPDKLRDFISWAHDQGYVVHACIAGGTSPPYMGAYEAFHDKAIEEMEGIINYNLAAGPNEMFDGVNVDIEPYISQDFKSLYPSLQLQYLDGLQKMINRINVAGINLPFGPAIPKWYDSSPYAENITWNGSTKWLSEHIIDISDYISIMDYRDTADGSAGIIAGAQDEIDYANSIGKPLSVVIGVETKDISNSGDPEVISFREEGRTYMEEELDKVYAAFNGDASFGGIAMHHYDDIPDLPSYWGEGGVFWEPPADTEPPGPVSMDPTASAVNYEQISIRFGMAMDNTEIDRYIVYRSTESGFTPGPSSVAGLARSLSFNDIGILPNTTYYYKVAAMDVQGNVGPASAEASATTESTTLKPMIVTGMHLTDNSGSALVHMKVIDKSTGQALPDAQVEGRFHFAGGTYTGGTVDSNGAITLSSEAIPEGHQIGFEPRRVVVAGYYWAQAYNQPQLTALYPRVGLSDLAISTGSLDFKTSKTSYNVIVPNHIASINLTPTALINDSVITIDGQKIVSGSASQDIPLNEGDNMISIIVTGKKGETDAYTLNVTRSTVVDNLFQAIEDTYVHQNDPTGNYGNSELLEVVDIPRAEGGGDRMAFMKFGFGAYSENVQSAVLNFYVNEDPTSWINLTIYSYDTDTWDESTMNWNNRLGAGSTTIGTVKVNSAGWHSIDVTSFVQNQIATDKTATFRIMDPNTRSILVQINSSEHTSNRPYLMLNPRNNADLSSLALSGGDLTPRFDPEIIDYEATVTNSVYEISVTPVTEDPLAVMTVNGMKVSNGQSIFSIPMTVGSNTINIAVTAQNGDTKSYSIVVTRQPSNDANLSALIVSEGTLNPTFASDVYNYSNDVASRIRTVTVTPTTANSHATVRVNGEVVERGQASEPIILDIGINVITVQVIAQDGNTKLSYEITIQRGRSAGKGNSNNDSNPKKPSDCWRN